MWTDKVKAVVIVIGFLLLCFLVWQWQSSRVSPEEIAKLEAAKIKAENSLKESRQAQAEKDKKIAAIESEKAVLLEESKTLEKGLANRDKIVELLKSQSEEDQRKILEQFDLYSKALENKNRLLENAEKMIAEMKIYNSKMEAINLSLNEQLQAALLEIGECQKKRTGKTISFGPGGGINAAGEFTWGFFAILEVGGL